MFQEALSSYHAIVIFTFNLSEPSIILSRKNSKDCDNCWKNLERNFK